MPSLQSDIRQLITNALKGATAAHERVYDSRRYNIEKDALPAIIVSSDHEDIQTETLGFPRTQVRELKLNISLLVKENNDASRVLDELKADVESTVALTNHLLRFWKNCRLESAETIFSDEGEAQVVIGNLVFNILYTTKEDEPKRIA